MLPPWAKDNPYLFIEIHKQALESPHVSHHLHAWIDLVFGFKQTGQAAIDAISVYHPAVSNNTCRKKSISCSFQLIPPIINITDINNGLQFSVLVHNDPTSEN